MHWIQKVWLHNFSKKKRVTKKFAFFMMQMNLTSFNIPSEVCKHISSTCLVGSLKICRSTQIWDLMNSSHYNKIWKKSTLCIPALQVHIQYIFLNRKFASKHKIHHFQIDTIFNPANRRKEFTVLFFFFTYNASLC